MKTYEVKVRTVYSMEWTHTIEAESREDAIDEAADLSEWDWSNVEPEEETVTCREITTHE